MKKKMISIMLVIFTVVFSMCIPTTVNAASNSSRSSYNDVFASTRGKGYNITQGKNAASKVFNKGDIVYVWGWVHDINGNLYKSYSSGTCNMTLSIYKPDGSCAHTTTYNNSDNNWIGIRVNVTGTWKIQSKISGSISGCNTQTIQVRDNNRSTYNDVFASLKGKGYNISQAKSSASSSFSKGDFVYVWGWEHDVNGNLYKSYSSGTCNMTLSIFRPDGSCAYTYTYNNSDNNWIGQKLDRAGTWKIQCKVTGSITGCNAQSITVRDITPRKVEISGGLFYQNPKVGDIYYLSAKAYPNDTKSFTWSSSNSKIVSISSSGKMTAKTAGTAYITVRTQDGRSSSVKITVSSTNKWKTGNFDSGYTAKGYTTVRLNANSGNGKIKIYTYDGLGGKSSGEVHITLRDLNGKWICEFDTKSGSTLNLGNNYGQYRVYIAKKKYSNSVIGQGDDFINTGKCQSWGIECISNCYIG